MKTDPPSLRVSIARHVLSLAVGLAVGVFLHYVLFRLTLPVQPFIYVSF